MDNFLEGKKGVVFGFANRFSIAWQITRSLLESGAGVLLTYQNERIQKNLRKISLEDEYRNNLDTFMCDITQEDQVKATFDHAVSRFKQIDFAVHSVAFAPIRTFEEPVYEISKEDFFTALEISSYSLITLVKNIMPHVKKKGCSIITMSYLGAERIIPGYNLMGIAKSTLESAVRYLSHDLGKYNVRINALSPGPVETMSSSSIPRFEKIVKAFRKKSVFKRNLEPQEIGDSAKFLISDWSRGISGETLYVDHSFNKIGI